MRRNLTAVMAADVVGYSRLMNEDSDTTLATLKRLKTEILSPVIASCRGRVVKSMGDGWIVTFGAVSDAVECGMLIQDRLKIDGHMQLRTGVHIGDVAEDEGDVFGDGVNIAARLQEIADPGSLAISDPVYALLDGTLRPSFDDAGERSLKNIPRPMRIWARGGDVAGHAASLAVNGLPRVVIRPIACTDDRAEVQDLAAALTGDLAYHLGGYRLLSARVSEGPAEGAYEIRSSLRTSGARLRLEVQMISPHGKILEAMKWDGDLNDTFDWQDKTGPQVAGRFLNTVISVEVSAAKSLPEEARSAEQWTLMTLAGNTLDLPGHLHVLYCIEQAIGMQPDNGFNYSIAASAVATAIGLGYGSQVGRYVALVPVWSEHLKRLEPEHSPARVTLAWMDIVASQRDPSDIRLELEAATRHLPFEVETLSVVGWVYLYLGDPHAALEHLRRLNPDALPDFVATSVLSQLGFAYILLGKYENAIPYLERSFALTPCHTMAPAFLAAVYGHLGRSVEAQVQLGMVHDVWPEWSISKELETTGFVQTPYMQNYIDGLRKAGVPE